MTQRQEAGGRVASTRCPFLVEVTAQSCRLAPFRKLVPELAIADQDQCCSSDAWKSCPWVLHRDSPITDREPTTGPGERCPFLDEMIACSCATVPSSKLIPRTQLAVSRCVGDSHRYCEFFLDRACPRPPGAASGLGTPVQESPHCAAAIPIPPGVELAPNHMWLDVGPDGTCHVGVDAFLARVLSPVSEVTFLSACGPGSPSLVLTVAGTTLPLVFPQPLDITAVNGTLRRHPEDLTSDPYRRGWLYEGRTLLLPERIGGSARTVRLLRGPDAEAWMASEVERLSRLVHTILSRRGGPLGPISADGGRVSEALAPHLGRAELLEVFSVFFAGGSQ